MIILMAISQHTARSWKTVSISIYGCRIQPRNWFKWNVIWYKIEAVAVYDFASTAKCLTIHDWDIFKFNTFNDFFQFHVEQDTTGSFTPLFTAMSVLFCLFTRENVPASFCLSTPATLSSILCMFTLTVRTPVMSDQRENSTLLCPADRFQNNSTPSKLRVNSMGNCRDRDEVYRKWVAMKVKDRNLTGGRPSRKDLQLYSWEDKIASVIPRENKTQRSTCAEPDLLVRTDITLTQKMSKYSTKLCRTKSEIYLDRFWTENIEKSSVQSRSYELDKSACVDAPPVKRKMEVKRKAACTCSAELMNVERGILQESKQRNELLKELNFKMDAMLAMKQDL
ncbi:LOW QUALITY PROTEIN: hypothetical protein MAR_027286 [Mya arenaria]|uniref:Uncharacterized protein n=1 Tax=Mya arenaria TaxID=6604 RepID=A0ABY7F167_MYAAR|nr:LOW QUALITY PROTEIN: hypothetical protein MAR_027286 [Mya arenaria]